MANIGNSVSMFVYNNPTMNFTGGRGQSVFTYNNPLMDSNTLTLPSMIFRPIILTNATVRTNNSPATGGVPLPGVIILGPVGGVRG